MKEGNTYKVHVDTGEFGQGVFNFTAPLVSKVIIDENTFYIFDIGNKQQFEVMDSEIKDYTLMTESDIQEEADYEKLVELGSIVRDILANTENKTTFNSMRDIQMKLNNLVEENGINKNKFNREISTEYLKRLDIIERN